MNSLSDRLHYLYVILITLLFVQCDEDDDFVYPDVRTDFMDLYTDGEGMISRVCPDSEGLLVLDSRLSGQGLRADTVYRAVGMYGVPDEEGHTSMYSATLVYAERPIRLEDEEKPLTDPLQIESVSRGGGYLNVVAQPMMQSKAHVYAFVEDSLVNREGHAILYLTLAHNQNGDRESFPRRVYLSIPLQAYRLSDGDSICFRANVYDKGMTEWRVAY